MKNGSSIHNNRGLSLETTIIFEYLKDIFLCVLHIFGKNKYFAYFKYLLNILTILRNYSEKKEEKPFFEHLFTLLITNEPSVQKLPKNKPIFCQKNSRLGLNV